jgi:NhaA family Na+:H+ antiporter
MMIQTKLFKEFFESESAGGLVLIFCTVFSLTMANLSFGYAYIQFWQTKLFGHSLSHWINDGLMAIFFLLIGLELEREIYKGELANFREALFPIVGAIGGAVFPAVIYLLLNFGTPTQAGFGIPMATDIAFALGGLSLLGKRVPISLKVFLTSLAVIDDLCAIIVIAIFYAKSLYWLNLFIALGVFALLILLNRLGVNNIVVYLFGGVIMWYFMLNSGVHATISGVMLAFAIPFNKDDEKSPSYVLQHFLHKPVAFLVLPIFALANTAITIEGDISKIFTERYGLGIILGLIVGKPLGIFLLTSLAVNLGLCKLPAGLKWSSIFGTGLLAGIGFTMSIFITLLAFEEVVIVNNSKLAILMASLISGLLGFITLRFVLKPSLTLDRKAENG